MQPEEVNEIQHQLQDNNYRSLTLHQMADKLNQAGYENDDGKWDAFALNRFLKQHGDKPSKPLRVALAPTPQPSVEVHYEERAPAPDLDGLRLLVLDWPLPGTVRLKLLKVLDEAGAH